MPKKRREYGELVGQSNVCRRSTEPVSHVSNICVQYDNCGLALHNFGRHWCYATLLCVGQVWYHKGQVLSSEDAW